jgi:hypothetical protein
MVALEPRDAAAAFLLVPMAAITLLCRFLAAHTRKPAVVWATGGYWGFLHLICLYGLLTSTRFDSGLAQLTLFTFPMSMFLDDTHIMQGFGSLVDLAGNYVRYVLCFGGLNALLLACFLALALPRLPPVPRQKAR